VRLGGKYPPRYIAISLQNINFIQNNSKEKKNPITEENQRTKI
jgi:hypothetical protein